jgi:CRP-like cAMP-binding protein
MLTAKDLRRYRIFMELVDEELEVLAPLAKEETREPGTRIITEGEPATHLYLVKSGKLQVRMTGASGEEVALDEARPGNTVGWSALTERRISTASVDVVEDSELISFEGERLRRLFEEKCCIGYGVLKGVNVIVSRRLDRCRTYYAARQ